MADYMNPAAFIPQNEYKLGGALGGLQMYEQQKDYRNIMNQQMLLQELARRRAAVETNQMEADVPLKNLQRQNQMITGQATQPYLGKLAATGAQRDLGQMNFDMSTKLGPEAKSYELAKLVQGKTDIEQKNFLTELSHAGRIANEAMQIAASQGQAAAIGYVQQQSERAKQAGINLPPQIANPALWKPLQEAGVQSVGHLQEMEKVKQQGKNQENVATITGKYHYGAAVDAVKARGEIERNSNSDQMYNHLMTKRATKQGLTDAESEHLKALVTDRWLKHVNDVTMAALTAPKKEGDKPVPLADVLDQKRDEYFAAHGFGKAPETPKTLPAGSKLIGKSKDGKDVYETPDGKRYTVK